MFPTHVVKKLGNCVPLVKVGDGVIPCSSSSPSNSVPIHVVMKLENDCPCKSGGAVFLLKLSADALLNNNCRPILTTELFCVY